MNVLLTITAGLDTGPFDIYTNVDNFTAPIEIGISKAQLVAGYLCTVVPNGATIIRVKSTGDCANFANANINFAPPTPTPTITPTQTPTPTVTPTHSSVASYGHIGTSNTYATSAQACAQATSRQYYSALGGLWNGQIVYETISLTQPVVGDSVTYRRIVKSSGGSTFAAFRINANGVIIETIDCP
jgi:hypothetical protein